MGKFHIKMGNVYNKLAGVLMDKGEYEAALSFYAKTYTIMDATLGIHDDTKQALDNIRSAVDKARGSKPSDILMKADEEFKKRHPTLNADSEHRDGDEDSKDPDKKKKSGNDGSKENGRSSTSSKGSMAGISSKVSEEEADII